MKALSVALILLVGTTLQSSAEAQLLPTKLRVTVINGLGNFVEGASVAIYETEADYRASENAIAVLKTDKKGRVTVKDVKANSYYIEATFGDQNNNGEGVKTGELSEGRINKVNTVIE